mmetsp:Transcript_22982/g.46984  ORF Transcript_22982/g.46984 Transcript_22982/m.46984 type:complete len:109 (+) Transcript_22982:973-1299(+)
MMTFRDSLLSMGNVSVIREGGGFGESSMEATKAFSSRSSGWFGNKEHVWPSGPKPFEFCIQTVNISRLALNSQDERINCNLIQRRKKNCDFWGKQINQKAKIFIRRQQ